MSIEEVAARAGVRVRTVRFYVAEGLLPGPGARGRAAAYGEEHLLRLRLIRRLAERHVPLAEMRGRLAGLLLDEVRSLLDEEDRTAAALAAGADSAGAYVSTLLRRTPVAPMAPMAPMAPTAPPAAIRETRDTPGAPGTPAVSAGALWQRWALAPGVELHVRHDAAAQHAPLIRRLREVAAGESGEPHRPAASEDGKVGGPEPPLEGLDGAHSVS